MKTIEEKAKAYDEALERAKKMTSDLTNLQAIREFIFPELRESEDERIGNVIYCVVRDNKEVKRILEGNGVSVDNALAYLEKQKEQKPTSFNEPYNPDEYEVVVEGNATSLKRKEQKPAWSEEDERKLNDVICIVGKSGLITSYREHYIRFLKSLRPQKLDASKLENFDPVDVLNRIKTEFPMAWEKVVWKPSEEQMEAFEESLMSVAHTENKIILESLYEHLKKLCQ